MSATVQLGSILQMQQSNEQFPDFQGSRGLALRIVNCGR